MHLNYLSHLILKTTLTTFFFYLRKWDCGSEFQGQAQATELSSGTRGRLTWSSVWFSVLAHHLASGKGMAPLSKKKKKNHRALRNVGTRVIGKRLQAVALSPFCWAAPPLGGLSTFIPLVANSVPTRPTQVFFLEAPAWCEQPTTSKTRSPRPHVLVVFLSAKQIAMGLCQGVLEHAVPWIIRRGYVNRKAQAFLSFPSEFFLLSSRKFWLLQFLFSKMSFY